MPETLTARAILDRLVAFPTVSRDSNRALIDWVQDYLDGHGIRTGRVDMPCGAKSQLYAHVGPDVAGGVMLSGHSDVVPVDGQDWSTDPWTVTERDGRLYGRGTCDMKGFDALAIAAMVRARDLPLTRPLQLALSCDEELGCVQVVHLIRAIAADLPQAGAVLVGEPSMMKVVTGHKGGIAYRVQMRGHEVHSSIQHRGVSAVMEAARLVMWANERNAESAGRKPGPLATPFDPPWTSVHVGMIKGGTAHNITARDCTFQIGFRTVPGDDPERWCADFEAEVARVAAGMQRIHPDAGIRAERMFDMPALRPEVQGTAEALARRLTGDNGTHVVSYGTEGGQFQAAGFSAVVCGPGDIAQAHQPDEYITVAQFQAGAAFMDRVLETLQT